MAGVLDHIVCVSVKDINSWWWTRMNGGCSNKLESLHNLHDSMWDHEIFYADRSWKEVRWFFVRNQKYKHVGRLNAKIHIWFYGDNSWNDVLRQINFGTAKYMVILRSSKLYALLFWLTRVLDMTMTQYFEVMLGQMFNHYV